MKLKFKRSVIIIGVVGVILGIALKTKILHSWLVLHLLLLHLLTSQFFPFNLLEKLTTRGAFIGGFIGLITAVVLVILSPTIWVEILGNADYFPI